MKGKGVILIPHIWIGVIGSGIMRCNGRVLHVALK